MVQKISLALFQPLVDFLSCVESVQEPRESVIMAMSRSTDQALFAAWSEKKEVNS